MKDFYEVSELRGSECAVGFASCLELSTANIQERTSQWLSEDPEGIIVYPKGEFGFFILVSDPDEDNDENNGENIPQDLKLIMEYAIGLRCSWIIIDRDYFENHNLPSYEWR